MLQRLIVSLSYLNLLVNTDTYYATYTSAWILFFFWGLYHVSKAALCQNGSISEFFFISFYWNCILLAIASKMSISGNNHKYVSP